MSFRKTRLHGSRIPFVLYHWSPRSRLRSIRNHGLRIGSLSTCRQWRPNHICLSNTPARALMLCPHIKDGTILDLYEVFPMLHWRVYRMCRPRGMNLIPEWRILNSVPKSRMYRIASRRKDGKRLPTL